MVPAAVALGALAVVLAWPVPVLLAGASWPVRAPGTALILWQAIALAGGLSMIGSLLNYGLMPFGSTLAQGFSGLGTHLRDGTLPTDTTFTHILALCGAIFLVAHLALNLAATFVRAERQRRRHHYLIDLLSHPLPDRPGMRVIDHAAPVAYCLPGATRSATVLTAGLLRLLNAPQLRAVIAHEEAHLQQKHHLVQLAFKSWHSALPWFPIANRSENAVGMLVELLADDQARRVVDDQTLATAIALVGSAQQPDSGRERTPARNAPDQPTDLVVTRVQRLFRPPPPLPLAATICALAAAAALLAIPTVLLLRA